jgi:hypothetical protein
MNVRRLVISLALLSVWLGRPAPASAHRLDEYLQATRVSIDIDHVSLEIDLTPGIDVASRVLSAIDANLDGRISPAEAGAYARRVVASLVLSVDGRPVPLAMIDDSFPDVPDMRLGVGTIRLRAAAKVAPAAFGRHYVTCINTHRAEMSVYLANALVPADPRIQITSQRRDPAQHELTVDYTVMPDAMWLRASSLLAGLTMVGVLVAARRSRR